MQFVPLRELQPCPSATFYAVVAAAKEPTKSKGTDYVLSFQLTDPTVENTFVSVQIFRRTLAELPSVQVGDVVKLSNVKVQRFNGKAQCLSTRQTACLAFPSDRKDLVARPPPDNSPEGAAEVDQEQDERPIAALRRWWRKSRERVEPAAMILPSARRPTLRQSELEANRFFDYYGEVLATRSITDTQCLVWLTDFTASPLLRPYEPEGLIPEYEPVCQGSVLPCIAWDANAVRAAGLVAGQIALFRNMLARDRDGFLEAHLHGDREGTATENRIRVIDIEDSSLLEFLEQRASVVSVPPRRISMCQPSQKRRISEAFDTEGEGSEASPSARRSKALSARTSLASAQSATPRTNRSRSIAEILMDNQVPNRYFCDAKVLDYLPRRTKDFAVPICDRCHASCRPSDSPECRSCPGNTRFSFEFRFSLLLGDGKDHLPVHVSGEEARHFFGRRQAENLHKCEQAAREIHSAMIRSATVSREGSFCVESFCPENAAKTSTDRSYRLVFTAGDRPFL